MTKQNFESYQKDLINIVAHDLKTPVGAAKSFLDLIHQTGELNERQRHFGDRAMAALLRVEELINNLLDFARLEDGDSLELTEINLGALFESAGDILGEMAAMRHINIHIDNDAPDLLIPGDERLLKQVVTNLLSNAIKYNRDGGDVDIRIKHQSNVVHVDIQDTGIGIPVKDQPRIFERFYRARNDDMRKISGSGLGLAITEMIIQMHGGHIRVHSTPGEGSTFSFTLPVNPGDISHDAYGSGSNKIDMPHVRKEFKLMRMESASERLDAVDDDTQEGFERPDSDSRSEDQ